MLMQWQSVTGSHNPVHFSPLAGDSTRPSLFFFRGKKMITSRTHKELYGEWQREREKALKDSTGIAATGEYSLEDLNITLQGGGVNDPETYLIDSTPVDPNTEPKINKIDIRTRPDCGD